MAILCFEICDSALSQLEKEKNGHIMLILAQNEKIAPLYFL